MEIKQLENQEVKEMKMGIRKYMEKNENKDTTHQNLFHALFRKIYFLPLLGIVFYRCLLSHVGLKCVVPALFHL